MPNFANTDIKPLDKDRLYMLPRDRAAVVAHTVLDPINDLPAHEQMAGAALLFYVLCSRFNLDPADMHSYAGKVLRPEPFHQKGNAQIEALEAYANLHKTGHVPL